MLYVMLQASKSHGMVNDRTDELTATCTFDYLEVERTKWSALPFISFT